MIWVIGCNGMLGKEISNYLEKNNVDFLKSDIETDITNIKALNLFLEKNKDKKITYIINCSAYTDVQKAEKEKDKAFLINEKGVYNLCLIAKKIDSVFIHISTDYVYDGKKKSAYIESDEKRPLNVYGQSKLCGENVIKNNLEKYYIFRTSWLYGPYGKNFVYTMLNLFENKQSINVVNDQIGSPTYTKTLMKVIFSAIKNKISYGEYNCTDNNITSWYEYAIFIKKTAEKTGLLKNNFCTINKCSTKEYNSCVIRPLNSVLSKNKIQKALNLQICSWQENIKDFLENMKK